MDDDVDESEDLAADTEGTPARAAYQTFANDPWANFMRALDKQADRGKESIMTARRLAIFMRKASCLRHLNLESNKLGDPGVKVISLALQLDCPLQYLNLSNTGMTIEALRELITMVTSNKNILYLIMDHNNFYLDKISEIF